jgi:hypothetical protein
MNRLAAEERLRSGADCKWIALAKTKIFHCRINGRLFRLEPYPDKKFHLFRVKSLEDQEGELVGRYGGRAEATKKWSARWRTILNLDGTSWPKAGQVAARIELHKSARAAADLQSKNPIGPNCRYELE